LWGKAEEPQVFLAEPARAPQLGNLTRAAKLLWLSSQDYQHAKPVPMGVVFRRGRYLSLAARAFGEELKQLSS